MLYVVACDGYHGLGRFNDAGVVVDCRSYVSCVVDSSGGHGVGATVYGYTGVGAMV